MDVGGDLSEVRIVFLLEREEVGGWLEEESLFLLDGVVVGRDLGEETAF